MSYWGFLSRILNRACGQKSGSASLASHTPSSPNPLGENITFSSPPLEPRGLLLSVMRQKVGSPKNTARKAAAPWPFPALFGPPPETATYGRSLSTCRLPSEKFRPRAGAGAPAYGVRCAPRTRDAKHREELGKTVCPPFPRTTASKRRAADAPRRKAGAARHPNRDCREKSELSPENRDRRSRAPPPPPAEGATSLLLRRLRGRL